MKIDPDAKCAHCGRPAEGFATINGDRYCHGDTEERTCYEQASYDMTMVVMDEQREAWAHTLDWLAER